VTFQKYQKRSWTWYAGSN